jgi:hypothetical protein
MGRCTIPDIDKYPQNSAIPKVFWPLLRKRDGSGEVINWLISHYTPKSVAAPGKEQNAWEQIALFYRYSEQPHQAIQVISALYDKMIEFQTSCGTRIHKGMPLVWLRDFHLRLGHHATAKRYAMLTLCEDAINDKGSLNAETGGIYFRLAHDHGMSDSEIRRYSKLIYEKSEKAGKYGLWPEWFLQNIDNDWIVDCPSYNEAFLYYANKSYVKYLLSSLGEPTGKALELLAEYTLSIIPGFRTVRRQRTPSTDYDIICSIEGADFDFRGELGRYMICECKDWSKPVDFGTVAKFCRILDSAKCKSGVIFSKKGITGKGKTKDADRERLKVFQDRAQAILIVDQSDLELIAEGHNFIAALRRKYEQVRLDLILD